MKIDLKKQLLNCKDFEIDLRLHVLHNRLITEQINEQDLIGYLNELKELDFKNLAHFKSEDAHKFILYFQHTKNIYYKCVIDIRDYEKKIRVVTVHKVHRDSQLRFEKYANK